MYIPLAPRPDQAEGEGYRDALGAGKPDAKPRKSL
jgi:hypothetical protein